MPAYVIAYESTHAAMASEAAFKRAEAQTGIATAMLPTPRAISAGCGMALRFAAADDAAALEFAGMPAEAHGHAGLYRETSPAPDTAYSLVGRI